MSSPAVTSIRCARAWYAALLHPVAVACAVLLVYNDHYLKVHHPSWLSGKLSDVAFMVLGPLWLHAAWLLLASLRSERPACPGCDASRRALLVCLVLILVTFVLMQTTGLGDWLYRYGLAGLQYPFRAAWALLAEARLPGFRPVVATPDPTDLICLPLLAVAWWIGARPGAARDPGRAMHRASRLHA